MDLDLKSIAEDGWLTQIRNYVPSAWIGHSPFLRFLIRDVKPAVFVELGTHNGFSYFVACSTVQELALPTKTFAIDHWLGDQHAGSFDEAVYQSAVILNRQYESFSTLLKMSFAEARKEITDPIDLLHIDGLHTYEAVKEDFYTWLPKMSQNGIILLHDIHVRHADFGVYKLWAEIRNDFSTIEFVGSYGLGVIFLGSIPGEALILLKQYSDSGEMMQVQGVFGALSDSVLQNYRLVETSQISSQLEIQRVEIDKLKMDLDMSNTALSIMRNSKSWRFTKPLRKILSLLN